MASRIKVVAVNKKTGKPYIAAEVDDRMPYMCNVRRTDKDGNYQVYTESVEFLSEEKQYFI